MVERGLSGIHHLRHVQARRGCLKFSEMRGSPSPPPNSALLGGVFFLGVLLCLNDHLACIVTRMLCHPFLPALIPGWGPLRRGTLILFLPPPPQHGVFLLILVFSVPLYTRVPVSRRKG